MTQNTLFREKKMEREIFVFCVITFEPIKIQTCLAPQNDGLNLRWRKNGLETVEKRQVFAFR